MSDRIKVGGLLNDSTHLPRENLRELQAPLYWYSYHPKWIISYGLTPERKKWLSLFSRGGYDYDCDTIKGSCFSFARLLVYWEEKTRPELPWHNFGPVEKFNPASEAVYVFKRKDGPRGK
jgi:hypothetical protein